jgi:SPP1 gp7 family putative phage head morphogenesis protein
MSKDTLDDPSQLKRYISEFEKKLIHLIRVHRAKSLKDLLNYSELSPIEKRFLLEHYDKLLKDLKKEFKNETDDLIYQAFFVAAALYRMNQEEWLVAGLEEIPQEQRLKEVWKVSMEQAKSPELQSIFRERANILLENVLEELKKDVDVTLQESDIRKYDKKTLQDKLDSKYKKAEYKAAMIVRTEMMFAFNQNILESAKKGGWTRVQWVTANDELVCPVCGPRHSRIYRIDDVPDIPVHPSCRCIIIPYDRL